MKTKASKRILSIFMTVLMLMSSVSMMFAYADTVPACQEPVGELVDFTKGGFKYITTPAGYTWEETRNKGLLKLDGFSDQRNIVGSDTEYPIANHKYEITFTLKMDVFDPMTFITFMKTNGCKVIYPNGNTVTDFNKTSVNTGWGYTNCTTSAIRMQSTYISDNGATYDWYDGKYTPNTTAWYNILSMETVEGGVAKNFKVVVDGFKNTMTLYAISGGDEHEVNTIEFTPDPTSPNLRIAIWGNKFDKATSVELNNVTIYTYCRDVEDGMDHKCDECGATLSEHGDGSDTDHICDYGCGQIADGGCWETDKDHLCDECKKPIGTHADEDNDHLCDYGCNDSVISVCTDENSDGICDICKQAFEHECEENDVNPKDHLCDRCKAPVGGEHIAADGKHTCDYCGERIGKLVDFTEGAFKHYATPDTCTWEITRAPGNLRVDGYSDQRNIVGSDTNYPIANHKYEINYTMKMDKVDSHTFVSFMKTNGYTVVYPDGDTKTFSISNINTGWGYVSSDNNMASGYLVDNGSMLFWEGVYTGYSDIYRLEKQPDGLLAKKFRLVIDGFENEMTLYVTDGTTEYEVGTIQYIPDPNNPNLRIGIYGNNFEAATRYEISDVTIYEHCSDSDVDHTCDVCDEAVGSAHIEDHYCAYCGKIGSECIDTEPKDHKCDVCGGILTECKDTDGDHYCNHCGKYMPAGIKFDKITLEYPEKEPATQPKDYYFTDKKLSSLPRTYEAWVNLPYDMAGGHQTILGSTSESDSINENNLWFYLTDGGVPKLVIAENGVRYTWTFSKSVVSRGAWTHIALAFGYGDNGDEVAFYINGELSEVSTTKITLTSPDSFVNDRDLRLGDDNYNLSAYSFKGILGNVAIYSDVRTADEIVADMHSVDVNDDGLLAYYRLDNAVLGEDIPDASGNGYDMKHGKTFVTVEEMEEIKAKDDNEYAYSIVFLPDTQYAAERYPDAFTSIYDYLIENKDSKNIKYVVSLGDMTNANETAQWEFVKEQTNRLNGIIPYTVLRGNHDNANSLNAAFGTSDAYYYNYVKENGGFMNENSVTNTYHLFEVGNTKYIILALDYHPSDAVLDWANTILDQYSNRLAIITTHSYLDSNLSRGDELNSTTSNSGEDMWNDLVKKHANVIMVVGGHISDDNVLYRKDLGDNGNAVYQFLMDTQLIDAYCNGVGVIAIMNFTEDGEAISIEYYSTYREMYLKTHNYITLEYDCYDNPNDEDVLCDYCGAVMAHECVDTNTKDHNCDICGEPMGTECSDKDNDGDHKCDHCGKDNVTNHDWIGATCETPKTCTECEATEGAALEHYDGNHDHICDRDFCRNPNVNMDQHVDEDNDHLCDYGCGAIADDGCHGGEATCTDKAVCDECGETYGEALGHKWNDATCETPKTCKECGETDGDKLGHSFTNYVYDGNATCTVDGTETAQCNNCDETDTRTKVGSALGHDYDAGEITTPATCTEKGVKTYTCQNDKAHTYTEDVDALGHTDGDDADHVCDRDGCDEVVREHNYTTSVTAPTCEEKGYTTYTCACGDNYVDDYVDALGHSFTNYVSNNDAACMVDGTKTAKCDNCNATDTITDVGSAPGHDYAVAGVLKEATCTEKGIMGYVCTNNPAHTTTGSIEINPEAHAWKETGRTDATCSTEGTIYYECEHNEGHLKTEQIEINKDAHDYSIWIIKPATCSSKGEVRYCCKYDFNHDYIGYTDIDPNAHYDYNNDSKCDGCGTKMANHTHNFDCTVVLPEYLYAEATCSAPAVYYFSCACGAKSDNRTFGHGDALGHEWGEATFVWGENYESCTRTCVCTRDASHKDVEEAFDIKVFIDVPVTCEKDGETTIIAYFKGDKHWITLTVEASGHNYGEWIKEIPAECEKEGTLGHYFCDVCQENFDADKKVLDSLVIEALEHADIDLDHECDNDCGTYMGEHLDANFDHNCDYGCKVAIGKCEDKDHDHDCDYGCDKFFGEHKDSATDDDHVCDYGCGEALEECYDGNDNNHNCDVCGNANVSDHDYEEEWFYDDESHCHKCTVCGFDSVSGKATHTYDQMIATNEYLKTPATETTKAVYYKSCICGKAGTDTFEAGEVVPHDCIDEDLDHDCDICGVPMGTCADADKNHYCDYGCGQYYGTCADSNKDHDCDYGCDKFFGTCEDENKDHYCDYGCDQYFGTHFDKDKDHDCDWCHAVLTICDDANKDHKCDICKVAMGDEHKAADGKHTCDYCGRSVNDCVDANGDDICDVCGKDESQTISGVINGTINNVTIKIDNISDAVFDMIADAIVNALEGTANFVTDILEPLLKYIISSLAQLIS